MGCECTSCTNINLVLTQEQNDDNDDSLLDVTMEELIERGEYQSEDVDEIMDWVFGDHEIHSDSSNEECT